VESFVAISSIQDFTTRVVAEISRFVIHPELRLIRINQFVHLGMLKLLYEYAGRVGLTDLFALSLPHLDRLYEMAMFRRVGQSAIHPTWGTVQAMHLNLEEARSLALARPTRFTQILFEAHIPNIIL
jgi:hypothetical protein